jgi:RNA polymerase sigma-70 factor (ECF subfamily)
MAAGDAGAVDAFYRQYFGWMYAQARRFTNRDESFCLDVVQDAVLRVIRTVKRVDCESRFRGWLRLVVQTTAFDLLRREARRKNREAMMGTSQVSVDSDSLQLDWLREQITQLDPELVNIVELRFEQSWTLRRIGEKLGISIGAVDGRLRRALKHLKLAAEEPEASGAIVVREPEIEQLVIDPAPALIEVPDLAPPANEPVEATASIEEPMTVIEIPSETNALVEEFRTEPAKSVAPEPELVASAAFMEAPQATGPLLFEPVAEVVEMAVEIEVPELIGLEDEAGAYDDKI